MTSPLPAVGLARLARVRRGGYDESWHHGVIVAVDSAGRRVLEAGDPTLATFFRSCAKPFQALTLVLADGRSRFQLDDADLALICASHSGRPEHVRRAASLLERGGFEVNALLCGAHEPLDAEAAADLRDAGEEPSVLHNNCSGKHAGMLLACRLCDWTTGDYISPLHALQRQALEFVARFAGIDIVDIGLGTDGCSAPAFRLPVEAAARTYAVLADPHSSVGRSTASPREAAALAEVAEAMTRAPEMVAGRGRFTTRLMEVTGGRVLGKEGAEGFYALAIRGTRPLGVAIKIADGGERARDGVVLETLRRLDALSDQEASALESFRVVPLLNRRAFFVGEVVPEIEWA